jgi:hypothetical protein
MFCRPCARQGRRNIVPLIEMPLSARGDAPETIIKTFSIRFWLSVSLHVKVPCVGADLNRTLIASLSQSAHRDLNPAAGLAWGWK